MDGVLRSQLLKEKDDSIIVYWVAYYKDLLRFSESSPYKTKTNTLFLQQLSLSLFLWHIGMAWREWSSREFLSISK